jgi:3-oxoacyl-[acyl-carrier-protein] synthase II
MHVEEDHVSRARIVVTGIGCISPLGNTLETTWDGIIKGRSGVANITAFDTTDFKTKFAAEVKEFDPVQHLGVKLARRTDRFTQFAIVAAEQAIAHAKLQIDDGNRDRIGVVIGTGIGGVGTLNRESIKFVNRGPSRVSPFLVPMMLPDTGPGQVAIAFGLRGPNLAVVSACASGSNSIGEAGEIIRRGSADVILAGGAEAAIVSIAMAGFNVMDAISSRNDDPQGASRPFDRDRDGFVAGEGGAILVLEDFNHAKQRGATFLAELVGYGVTNDAYHISAPAMNGEGAARCMTVALQHANLQPKDIGYVNAHGTSTPLNDPSETAAIKTVLGDHAYQVPVSSTKSMTGHLLGAAGALEAAICIKALNESTIPPTINYQTPDPDCDLDYVPNVARQLDFKYALSNSFGFGGHNATLILGKVSSNGAS